MQDKDNGILMPMSLMDYNIGMGKALATIIFMIQQEE